MKNAPTNLDELLEMIVEYNNPNLLGNYMTSEEFVDHKTIPPWKGAPMAHGELDMTSLPNFGGPEPSPANEFAFFDSTGIWSWDETRMIVGDGSADLVIVERTFETPNMESDESVDSIMRNEAKEEN